MRTYLSRVALAGLLITGCTYQPISAPTTAAHHPVAAQPEPDNWRELLPAQIAEVNRAASKWQDYDAAIAAGWEPFGGEEPLMGQHFHNPSAPDYVSGDLLDFSQPNNLMYATLNGKKTLTGVAFVVRIGEHEPVPAGFAGPKDAWHVHNFLAAINAATEDRPFVRTLAKWWMNDNYFSKGDNRYRLAMVHVWTETENPDGVFANYDRTLPYRKLGLPISWSQGASLVTARGLDIATPNGCNNALGGHAWIANLSGKQEKQLKAACARGAKRVKAALPRGQQAINQAAVSAWLDYAAVQENVLTQEQKQRISAMMEHGHHH
ncbi:hypothetical protein L1F30_02820 [Simiduia sp. 21SJ11W-1]|uniref:hypothetical protein n=1 Tax=Simiduia sp. 21SJ11W-1 TaxID=2909669 RepID=UPI00209D64AB|nr:hypothetical protein [Simiduia sp. 21SJ11W-1]UTA48486.1 hypothetical protein L1F30_02820 [Simiduia sp. 21SJ11W-1]